MSPPRGRDRWRQITLTLLGLLTVAAAVRCGDSENGRDDPPSPTATSAASPANTPAEARQSGSLCVWGNVLTGPAGELTSLPRPTSLSGLADVTEVSAGGTHSLGLLADGTILAWGEDSYGQLGNGLPLAPSPDPVGVVGITDAVAVAAGGAHSLALLSDGTVVAWGYNATGQVGDGSNTDRPSPVVVSEIGQATGITAGDSHSLALGTDAKVWAWGYNAEGQLGTGTRQSHNVPQQILDLEDVVQVAAGGLHSLALLGNGKVAAWGHDGHGQIGDGEPIDNTEAKLSPTSTSDLADVVFVSAGGLHSLALTQDGTVWAWGYDAFAQLGNGPPSEDTSVPTPVSGLGVVKLVAATGVTSFALEDKKVFGWGRNTSTELGLDKAVHPEEVKFEPVQVPGVEGVIGLSAGWQTLAIIEDSNAQCGSD